MEEAASTSHYNCALSNWVVSAYPFLSSLSKCSTVLSPPPPFPPPSRSFSSSFIYFVAASMGTSNTVFRESSDLEGSFLCASYVVP